MKIAQLVPIVLSALLPGIGHIAAGRALKGLLIFFLFGFAVDGWLYAQVATVLPPEHVAVSVPVLRNGAIAFGALLWAFAVFDTAAIALRHRRVAAKATAADAHIANALVAYLRDDPDAALRELRAARRIDDHDPDALFHLGVAHALRGDKRRARRAFHKCIRYDHDGKWDALAQQQLEALEAPQEAPAPAPSTPESREEGES